MGGTKAGGGRALGNNYVKGEQRGYGGGMEMDGYNDRVCVCVGWGAV